ncbi:uncharacterized protein LOC26528686 [Drosophila mojavensis]|uniref:THAP-type domain-containing protein n=1 Tax=Drosophila mojavensis TaxID=7230 RepID=A0A0Q9XLY1_DROMO|nr:uncharacterized protein LOC26528686 [Drosophila mojavensis]KRG06308.1 uncharacterized protein Dmoj_GI27045 [Drosophila mojavensis]
MGGTRCVFRDCQVSTQRNPKMHFFKLPVRDPVRLETWLKNCGNADILNVAKEKLSNRAVCARHFRYECFMNYKLDRLIPNQTPTLVRVSKDLAWDMEHLDENGEATMVKLSMPTLEHLIPPPNFECPLGFTDDARFGRKYVARRRTPPKPLILEPNKRQKLVHEQGNTTETSLIVDTGKEQPLSGKDIDMGPLTDSNVTEEMHEDYQLKYEQLRTNFEQLSKENADLKQTIERLEAQAEVLKSSSSTSVAPQLTKSQLYNGIKKYLGATMAALVRMEMFGGAERPWKEDERDFSKELLQLGEHVYTHCCDEWRFRLPSLRMARSWLEDKHTEENEGEQL